MIVLIKITPSFCLLFSMSSLISLSRKIMINHYILTTNDAPKFDTRVNIL